MVKILLSKQNLRKERKKIMFDKEKFKDTLKENRGLYITAISILLAMILLVAAVAATNRAGQTKPTPDNTTTTTTTKKPNPTPDDPTSDV